MNARGALLQARAHTMFVDAAYVVCDDAYRSRFQRMRDVYARERVGLIALASSGDFELLLRARRASLRDSLLRALGTERALARMFDPVEQETAERRLPTASELGGLRTAPVLMGGRAREIRDLLHDASPDATRQLVIV